MGWSSPSEEKSGISKTITGLKDLGQKIKRTSQDSFTDTCKNKVTEEKNDVGTKARGHGKEKSNETDIDVGGTSDFTNLASEQGYRLKRGF